MSDQAELDKLSDRKLLEMTLLHTVALRKEVREMGKVLTLIMMSDEQPEQGVIVTPGRRN